MALTQGQVDLHHSIASYDYPSAVRYKEFIETGAIAKLKPPADWAVRSSKATINLTTRVVYCSIRSACSANGVGVSVMQRAIANRTPINGNLFTYK